MPLDRDELNKRWSDTSKQEMCFFKNEVGMPSGPLLFTDFSWNAALDISSACAKRLSNQRHVASSEGSLVITYCSIGKYASWRIDDTFLGWKRRFRRSAAPKTSNRFYQRSQVGNHYIYQCPYSYSSSSTLKIFEAIFCLAIFPRLS